MYDSHGVAPTINKSPAFIKRIDDSVALVTRLISEGKTIYGELLWTQSADTSDTYSTQASTPALEAVQILARAN